MKNLIRQTNKYLLNPLMLKLAAQRGPFAVVDHRGRKSGKSYRTPVIAMPINNGFMLALTYGEHVDWYKNVLSAGRCSFEWHGQKFEITTLKKSTDISNINLFPKFGRPILRLLKINHFLEMDY